jgi:ActR/RegA family two-component response regulator
MAGLFGSGSRPSAAGSGVRPLCDMLLVDDDPFFLNLFSRVGSLVGLKDVQMAQTLEELQGSLTRNRFRIIFLDHQLLDGTSDSVLAKPSFAKLAQDSEIIVASGFKATAIQAVYKPFGVKLFLEKPISAKALQDALTRAIVSSRSRILK